jgi:hypothetical protein
MDLSGSGERQVESSCECGNELSDLINAEKFFSDGTAGGLSSDRVLRLGHIAVPCSQLLLPHMQISH